MKADFSIEGLADLDRALGEMSKATARNTLKRAAKESLKPTLEAAKQNAPAGLGEYLKIGPTLNKNQKKMFRKSGGTKYFAEEFMGSPSPRAHLFEFGTSLRAQITTGRITGMILPQPFMRPAWDSTKAAVLSSVGSILAAEIKKTADRAARKAARLAKKAAG